ncbi:MAG: surface carbohydrate biosynthesis protein [Caldimonas sp.]
MTQRICLVVDNPLRDLDGLVLVAWELARRGVEAWLVPMYEQAFDVQTIKPDLVLLNYVRSNNLELVKAYQRSGSRVGVLDTEGTGGKSADEFAMLVANSGAAGWVDLYCTWGTDQLEALERKGIVAAAQLRLTGCPRYDFCASRWLAALPVPAAKPGYVLVNTNFSVVNPRFSASTSDERNTMVKAGFSPEFADAYVRDARVALQGVLALLAQLLAAFPERNFILRPHPFESHEPYRRLEAHGNFQIRQEGTSVEWLNQASALVHLNCSTALEAAMLGKPRLSPSWLDTPALNVPGPHRLSRQARTPADLVDMLGEVLAGPPGRELAADANGLRPSHYLIDGHAAARVAEAVVATLAEGRRDDRIPRSTWRGRSIALSRRLFGHRSWTALQVAFRKASPTLRRLKSFSGEQVSEIAARLDACAGLEPGSTRVDPMDRTPLARSRLASRRSVRVSARPLGS